MSLSERVDGSITLPGGRQLGYAEYGRPDGRPLLWFPGTPGARSQLHPATIELALRENIRLIGVERPGIGDSTPHLYGSVVEWARDIEVLINSLGIDRFAVAGLSGGGPYALACAHQLPERVVTAVVLGGVAPAVGPEAAKGGVVALMPTLAPAIARLRKGLGRATASFVRLATPFAEQAMDLYMLTMPPGDRRIFSDPATRRTFQQDLIRGSREGGMQAMFNDVVLFGRPWGFSLSEIRVPVLFYHGDADNLVPLSHGKHMASLVPRGRLTVGPEEGHLGGLGASRAILEAVDEAWAECAG